MVSIAMQIDDFPKLKDFVPGPIQRGPMPLMTHAIQKNWELKNPQGRKPLRSLQRLWMVSEFNIWLLGDEIAA